MTRVVEATAAEIARAAEILRRGGLVAFPTETVYGLGAIATNDRALSAIYAAKGRPASNPLIVHVEDLAAARALAVLDDRATALATQCWPGPLTLVLPAAAGSPVSRLATAGLATVAVRMPSHPIARALLRDTMLPVAAPSANPSGRISPTNASHVAEDLAHKVELVLDGGPTQVGLESTVIDLSEPRRARLLRPGAFPREHVEALVGPLEVPDGAEPAPRSPGQLASHYAPRLPVRLDAVTVETDEALLAFGPEVPAGARITRNLSPRGDLEEASRNLFAHLRELDRSGAARIAVMPIPPHGLGDAIRDRLARAAAPRPSRGQETTAPSPASATSHASAPAPASVPGSAR